MLSKLIATWFGCGYFPVGPGTVGSAAAILIAWAIESWLHWPPAAFAGLAIVLSPAGIWAADRCAHAVAAKDPGIIVVDEVLGQWLTLAGAAAFNWKSWLAGFLLFRLFDILKPQPARRLEALPGGLGIVADDLMAGIYAAAALYVAGWLKLY